jgi:hypothetical protein
MLVNLLVALGLLVGGLLLYPALADGNRSLPAALRQVIRLLRRSPLQILSVVALAVVAYLLAYLLLLGLLLLSTTLTSMATVVGAGALPAGEAFQPAVGPLGQPDMRLVPQGIGDLIFLALSLGVYGLLIAVSITLFNALGVAVYLSVNPVAPAQAVPVAQPNPALTPTVPLVP